MRDRLFIPNILVPLLQLAAEESISSSALLDGSGVSEEQIFSKTPISVASGLMVLQNVVGLSQNPLLGIELGQRLSLGSVGVTGYAEMTAATVRKAIEVAAETHALHFPSAEAIIENTADKLIISYNHIYPVGEVRRLLTLALISMQLVHAKELFLHRIQPRPLAIQLDFPDDGYYEIYADRFLCSDITFGADNAAVTWAIAGLDMPRPVFDAVVSVKMEEIARQRLAKLTPVSNLAEQLKVLLLDSPGMIPSLDAAAEKLCMSGRSLRRKLADLGTSYQEVLTSTRLQFAKKCLLQTGLTVKRIAELCGFAESHNFSLAFKRWTGMSPTEYRRRGQLSE